MTGRQWPSPAFPFDAAMPELPGALDPAIVGPLLARHLPSADGPLIEACRVTRIRYRPHERCVMQYELTGPRRADESAAPRYFVTGTLFADPRRAARRAARSGSQYLPELRMQFSVFPGDPKLPHAQTLVNASDPELRRTFRNAFGAGRWDLTRCECELVRYREGLSLVLRFVVVAQDPATGASARRVFYAKAYPRPQDAAHAFAHLTSLSRAVNELRSEIKVDRPLACLDHLATVVLPSAEGQSLSEIIESAPLDMAIRATRRSALAVADLHRCSVDGLRVYDAPEFGRSLQRPLRILGWAQPKLKPLLREIVERVDGAPSRELVPTHRDMKPEHLLLDSRTATFIDLDSCSAADPVLDVALMLARLAVLAQHPATRTAGLLAAEFEQTYFRVAPEHRRARLPLLLAASLVEVAAGLFHRQEADWRERIPALVDLAHGHTRGGRRG